MDNDFYKVQRELLVARTENVKEPLYDAIAYSIRSVSAPQRDDFSFRL